MADDSELDVAVSLKLSPRADAARRARKFVTDFCRAAEMPVQLCQTAALLVSELVTNAVIHGRTSATVEVHRPADTLRVTVRDDNPDLPAVGDAPDFTDEHGRGLLIVSKLARRWGVEPSGDGKAVWFELAVRD